MKKMLEEGGKMKRLSSMLLTLGACGLCLTLAPANATVLPPGGSVSPGAPTSALTFSSATVVATQVDPITWFNGPNLDGNVKFTEAVIIDPGTGNLDFFYQIQNNSPAPSGITQSASTLQNLGGGGATLTLNGFGPGVTENVFQITNSSGLSASFGNASGTNDIVTVSRTSTSDVISFNNPITPGTESAILLIKTNAAPTAFTTGGTANLRWRQNPALHGATSGTAFSSENITVATLVPTPEPGVYGLLSLAIAGLFFAVHRRSGKAKAGSENA
jgi:hypothetical protein